jgi:hypothetical protein
MRAAALLFAAAAVSCAQQPGDLRQLVADSLRFVESDKGKDLDYSWRSDRKQFDSSGKITSQTTLVGEKTTVDGVAVHRVLEKDGRKLSEKEAREQEAKIREAVEKAKAERRAGKKGDGDAWVKEVGDALEFKMVGEELVNGRSAWVLTCSPRPGYSPRNMRARVFTKMNGRMWIDKEERQLVRAEAETFDTVSVAMGLLGRVEKGTRFQLARTRLPDGMWVLDTQSVRFGARVMMVKWLGNEIHTRHWNYRRSNSKPSGAN